MSKTLLFIIASTCLLYSCSKSSEDNYTDPDPNPGGGGGNNTCDTSSVEYQADIVPILQANCYSCHGEATNSGSMGIILEGHQNIKPKADNGTLIGVVTHANGFPAMPKDGTKLSECNINTIRAWINNGAQDD